MRALPFILLFALAACSPKPVAKPPAPPPKTVVGDFSRPMDARGTEPFWNVAIRGTTLTLTRPDQPIIIATAPGAVIQPNQASWTGKSADGTEMKVTLYASPCSDGMSDHVYPYTAEVDVPGQTTLNGCGDTVAALAKGPKP
jgi:uncharacterized membrane protein